MRRHDKTNGIWARAMLVVVYAAFLLAQLSFNVEQAGNISSHFFLAAAKTDHHPHQKKVAQGKFTQPGNAKSNFRLNKRFQPEKSIGIITGSTSIERTISEVVPGNVAPNYNEPVPQLFLLTRCLRGPPVVV